MKQLRSWLAVLPVSALVLSACNEKKIEEAKAGAETVEKKAEAAVEKATGGDPAPVVAVLTPGQRAAFTGIMAHLSKDTESAFNILDGREIAKRLRSLKTWAFIGSVVKEQGGDDIDAQVVQAAGPAGVYLGQEIFLAAGKGTSDQVANLRKINAITTRAQFAMLTQAFASTSSDGMTQAKGTEMGQALGEAMRGGGSAKAYMDLLKDSSLMESLQMPPVLAGIKADSPDTASQALAMGSATIDQYMTMMAANLPDAIKAVKFTKGGADFKGYSFSGDGFSGQLDALAANGSSGGVSPADLANMKAALKGKNIVVAFGKLDSYLMVYIGDKVESCPLVDKAEDSLVANDDFSFVDGFASQKVVSVFYGDQALAKASITANLKPIADGIRDGLAKVPVLGDTHDIAALLDTIGDKEKALLAMAKAAGTGGVAVLDHGVKFEAFGGTDFGAIDLESEHKFSNLPHDDDTLITADWIANPGYQKAAGELGKAIVETAYSMVSKVAAADIKDADFSEFKQGFALFDTKFRPDVLSIGAGLDSCSAGMGTETAFVVDLKGAMPAIPNIPQDIVDESKFIRFSMLSPVTDRSKISDGWTKIYTSTKNILKSVSELSGSEIPMLQPVSSEKNDLTTWSFALPFTSDDFNLSVTVSDKWFAASSSRKQALELISAAESGKGGVKGASMEFNFEALRKYGSHWVDMVDKHGDTFFRNPAELADFRKDLPKVREGLEAVKEWDKIEFYSRKEGGKQHTTFQIKMK